MRWLIMLSIGLTVFACKNRNKSLQPRLGVAQGMSDSKQGDIGIVSAEGILKGWALNPANVKEIVTVRFFDSAEATVSLGETKADQAGFDNNRDGDHAFTWQVPKELCDGSLRQLYVRVVVSGKEQPLVDSAKSYNCYQPTIAGKDYYNATVAPVLKVCADCHQFTYEKAWGTLASPIPANGGTSINNGFIAAPAAETRHGGGKICPDINTTPCKEIQEWWKKEFSKG